MLTRLSNLEKLATAVSSCVLAALAFVATLKLEIFSNYENFIVGRLTWDDGAKLQDLIVGPVFILVLVLSFSFFSSLLTRLKNQFGNDYSDKISNQLVGWSMPTFAALATLFLGPSIEGKVILISAIGLIFIGIGYLNSMRRNVELGPEVLGLTWLSIILISLVPLELALALGRLPVKFLGDLSIHNYTKTTDALFGLGAVIGLYFAIRYPTTLSRYLAKLLFAGQVGLPILFLTLYPAKFLQPTGELTEYKTTVWLKILIICMISWGIYDVIRRYRKYSVTKSWSTLLSPIVFFSLVIWLKIGHTSIPVVGDDDYHFGEYLLGWWSYSKGFIPYLDYLPAHGLIENDFRGFLSLLFYDGTAASVFEADRLAVMVLAFFSFVSIYYFSGSLGLASVAIYFLDKRLAWFFLVPFICIWFSRSLIKSPSKWLIAWLISVPIVILGVPPQGLMLVLASCVVAVAVFARLQQQACKKNSWVTIAIVLVTLALLGLLTPLGPMLYGAVRYVLENGPINQVAYGLPWSLSWTIGAKTGFIFEAIRMSWLVIQLICLIIAYTKRREIADPQSAFYPAIFALFFMTLMIPYSMGRIDPGHVSRPGLISIFGWTVLFPVVGWVLVQPKNRVSLILLMAVMSSFLNYRNISVKSPVFSIEPKINTPLLRDGKSIGLANMGKAHVQADHWDRLIRLNALLSSKLSPEETYLDLTSRHAQYFHLNRLPVMAITAPYNMVALSQQKRAVESLSKKLPKLALLEGDNIIHDGGGLGLRNPYLYRFIVDNYIPRFENGFIFGYEKSQKSNEDEPLIDLEVKKITDANWDQGFHRLEAAIALSDPGVLSFIKVGDLVRIEDGNIRKVKRKTLGENGLLWLEGAPIFFSQKDYPNIIHVVTHSSVANAYRASLFQRAFSQTDLKKIPVAWGRSEKSLKSKMTLIKSFDAISANVHQLIQENKTYKINGVDPQLGFDLSNLELSGREAGLLRFDFACVDKNSDPNVQIFWWGDDDEGAFEASSMKFIADNGTLIVPLDASPLWLTLKKIKGLRISLRNASACRTFRIEKLGLYQRTF